MRNAVLDASHNHITAGHLSYERTVDRIQCKYYWPNMKTHVREWIQACAKCNSRNTGGKKYRQPLQPLQLTEKFAEIAIDTLFGFPITSEGNKHVLVCIERATRWLVICPLKDASTAATMARAFLDDYVFVYGAPRYMLSDNASTNISAIMMEINKILGIKAVTIAVGHSMTNRLVERQNRTILTAISKFCSENGDDWDRLLKPLQFSINTSMQKTTVLFNVWRNTFYTIR